MAGRRLNSELGFSPGLIRRQLGLAEELDFEDGFGPRAIDIELLEKHLQRELDESLDHEVSYLITTYTDWRDAYATVLRKTCVLGKDARSFALWVGFLQLLRSKRFARLGNCILLVTCIVLAICLWRSSRPESQSVQRATVSATHLTEADVPKLVRAFDDNDPSIRRSAATLLSKVPSASKSTVPLLMRLLNDDDVDCRFAAAESLVALGAAVNDDILASCIESVKYDLLRYRALASIKAIGPNATIPYLEKQICKDGPDRLLIDTVFYVDLSYNPALVDLALAASRVPMESFGQKGNETVELNGGATNAGSYHELIYRSLCGNGMEQIEAIRQLGGCRGLYIEKEITDCLTRCTRFNSETIRVAAACALLNVNPGNTDAAMVLLQVFKNGNSMVRYLTALLTKDLHWNPDDMRPIFIKMLASHNNKVRRFAAVQLGTQDYWKAQKCLPALEYCLSSEDKDLKLLAAKSLVDRGGTDSTRAMQALAFALYDGEEGIRSSALDVLLPHMLKDSPSRPFLEQLANSNDKDEREWALMILEWQERMNEKEKNSHPYFVDRDRMRKIGRPAVGREKK